ncbi:hypothetical protein [Kineosporia babensis]|uniref:Uncharacterized protein n=1 Tax=Kineosporia babensis TaxID=499548 RepID=A0A9X1ST73_9ACTN|nr:hypothetical protein [Kineosporia babensis]MCD5311036.1 hypothetical protein [Kineosporia babensis]
MDEVAGQARGRSASVTSVTADLAAPGDALTDAAAGGRYDVIVAASSAKAAIGPQVPACLEGLAWAAWHWGPTSGLTS